MSQIREMFQCRNCITTCLDDRTCLAFVISNMLRIDSQSILRLIARLNPPRSRQRPFLEYLYAINNSSTGELVANYVNGLDRRVTSTDARLRTRYFPYQLESIIRCNQSTVFTRRSKLSKHLSENSRATYTCDKLL